VVEVSATAIATELGSPLVASMVMAGAYSAGTGLVGVDALVAAIPEALPPYRSEHVEANTEAIRAGHDGVDRVIDAWAPAAVAR
jgi:Pyruvate/2-oxoacid:ferredoxin oxidoreductase gamma subunit